MGDSPTSQDTVTVEIVMAEYVREISKHRFTVTADVAARLRRLAEDVTDTEDEDFVREVKQIIADSAGDPVSVGYGWADEPQPNVVDLKLGDEVVL